MCVVTGVFRPVLLIDMSPLTKKNVVGMTTTTMMWQWDRLVRKVIWEEVWVVAGVFRPVLQIDMSPSTKKKCCRHVDDDNNDDVAVGLGG